VLRQSCHALLVVAVCLCLVGAGAPTHRVVYTDGRTVEGRVIAEAEDSVRLALGSGEIRIPRRRIARIDALESSERQRDPSGRKRLLPGLAAEVVVPYGWHVSERLPDGALPMGRFWAGRQQSVFVMSPEAIEGRQAPLPRLVVLRSGPVTEPGVRALDEARRLVKVAAVGSASSVTVETQPEALRIGGMPAAHYALQIADPARSPEPLLQDAFLLIKPDRLYTIDAVMPLDQAARWRSVLRQVAESVRVTTNPEYFPLQKGRVVDRAAVLSVEERQALSDVIARLEEVVGIACAVVTVSSIAPYRHPEAYVVDLLHLWNIGADHPKGGALLLVSQGGQPPALQLGFGAEILVLSDAGDGIVQQHVAPVVGQPGRLGAALVAAIEELGRQLTQ